MSAEQLRVCSRVLEDAFGDIVGTVASCLISNGTSNLSQLSKRLNAMDKSEIKKCLMILIQHQLVTYVTNEKTKQVMYSADVTAILRMVRYPRYVHTGQEMSEEIGELIIESIVLHGQISVAQCVERANMKLSINNVQDKVSKSFEDLVMKRYIQKVKTHSFDTGSSYQPIPISEKFLMPFSNRGFRTEKGVEPVAKRERMESTEDDQSSNNDVLWFLNHEQFHVHYRHQSIIQAVGERVDPTSSIIIRTIIKTASMTNNHTPFYSPIGPKVYPSQILDNLPNNLTLSNEVLERYLSVLVDEQFVSKTGDAGGGSYCINYKKCSEQLCQAVIESVVRERFGSKSLRVFKLLLQKRHMEQKHISDVALIPNKECKEILYMLLAENFVLLQEIPRANDYTPSRMFYLFSVNINDVARVVLQRCYKGLGNLMMRRKHEQLDNKRLLEKYAHWEKQQVLAEEAHPSDIEEVITPSERETAERVKLSIDRLQQGEFQLDYTAFIIEDYLGFLM